MSDQPITPAEALALVEKTRTQHKAMAFNVSPTNPAGFLYCERMNCAQPWPCHSERLAHALESLAAQVEAAGLELDRFRELLLYVARCGADDVDPRMDWVNVQIDRELWGELRDLQEEAGR
jgi:hypothetical protein